MLKQRRSNGEKYNDLSELLEDAMDKGLDMDENTKIGNCLLAYFAGTETVSGILSQAFRFLMENPEVKEKLLEEIKKEFSNEITYENLTPECLSRCCFK